MNARRVFGLAMLFWTSIVLRLPLLHLRGTAGEHAILGRYPVDYSLLTRLYVVVAVVLSFMPLVSPRFA